MPILLPTLLNFQGTTHLLDVGSFNELIPESVKFILFCNQLSKQNWLSITLIAVFFQFPH